MLTTTTAAAAASRSERRHNNEDIIITQKNEDDYDVMIAPPPPSSSLSSSNINNYIIQYKRTRRGRIRRIIRECYLRDDISCGIMECNYCKEDNILYNNTNNTKYDDRGLSSYSSSGGSSMSLSIEYGIPILKPYLLIIPTPEVCIKQLDWLCDSLDIDKWYLGNIVITYTALNVLKSRKSGGSGGIGGYDRLRKRCNNINKNDNENNDILKTHFHIFPNEYCRQTYIPLLDDNNNNNDGDDDNDDKGGDSIRDTKATLKVGEWYNNHIGINSASLILCNDINTKNEAINMILKGDNINNNIIKTDDIITCEELCSKLHSLYPTCAEKLSIVSNNNVKDDNKNIINKADDGGYTGHYTRSVIDKGLQNGTLYQGILRCSVTSWQRGKIIINNGKEELHIIIRGRYNINRAVDNDIVAVELIDEPTRRSSSSSSSSNVNDDDNNEEVLVSTATEALEERVMENKGGGIIEKEGKVVGIIKRNWRQYAGTLRPTTTIDTTTTTNDGGGGVGGYSKMDRIFIPANPRIPNIRILTRHSNDLDNMRICVTIDTWDRTSILPQGHWTHILGKCGDRDTESSVILHEHNIITREFSDDVIRCLPPKDYEPDENEISRRLDLRNVIVCSIDPPGCKDIDDALSCEVLDNGNWRIGVHIADVTHFVHPGTAIDKEASERCTTVYLVERRTDMLPSLLTTDLCSLVGDKDRLCFTVLWEMEPNNNFKIVNTEFHKAIIRSNAALSYGEAQARIDDKNDNTELTQSIRRLLKAAMVIRKDRMNGGALELASQEVRFELDSETSDPTDVAEYTMKDTNRLVEEFMLLANCSVAKQILKHFPSNSVLRRHPPPKEQQLKSLKTLLEKQGIYGFKFGNNKELSDSLNRLCIRDNDPYFNRLVRIMTTRTMNQAQYFCTGEVENGMFSHYGLAMGLYTHFTSPIRRYADILVHRLLMASLGIRPLPDELNDKTAVTEQCDKINFRHRNAQFAGRASAELHTYLYFKNNGPSIADAVITRVRSSISNKKECHNNDNASSSSSGSLQVVVPRFGIDGICKLINDNDNNWECDEDKMIAKNNKLGIKLSVFDHIQVKIMADDTDFRFKTVMTLLKKSDKNEIDSYEEAEANRKIVDKEMCPDRITKYDSV